MKIQRYAVLTALAALIFSACLLEGDIDQIRPRLKTEEPPKDPYADYVLIPVEQLNYNPKPATGPTVTITGYTGPGGKVRIPATIDGFPVVAIGFSAFNGKQLTGVTIPNGIQTIGDGAFCNNYQLTSVTIPNSVQTIGGEAFRNTQLTSVTIPNGVQTIGVGAFSENKLTSVTIPGSVIEIGLGVFTNNPITSITFMGSGIPSTGFGNNWMPVMGNLQILYLDAAGGAGTYTRPNATSGVWTKQ